MLVRELSAKELKLVKEIATFVEEKHRRCEGHDYSHVAEVTRYAIAIASGIPEKVDPFVLICGALLHDIGRVDAVTGRFHGLTGASITEEFLESTWVDDETIRKISRIVARHTPTTRIPPQTIEERIVYDADTLERFGWIGLLRGIIGKKGSIKEILNEVICKRAEDYNTLLLPKSKELGRRSYEETMVFVRGLKEALERRCKEVDDALRDLKH